MLKSAGRKIFITTNGGRKSGNRAPSGSLKFCILSSPITQQMMSPALSLWDCIRRISEGLAQGHTLLTLIYYSLQFSTVRG